MSTIRPAGGWDLNPAMQPRHPQEQQPNPYREEQPLAPVYAYYPAVAAPMTQTIVVQMPERPRSVLRSFVKLVCWTVIVALTWWNPIGWVLLPACLLIWLCRRAKSKAGSSIRLPVR